MTNPAGSAGHPSDAGPSWLLCSPILELRQYTTHPGQRDTLIELFDREFVESQEALGMRIIGQFRDLDDPNRFVWLRGFDDMQARHEALQSFYSGPVWKAHSAAANATMVTTDNVLLLHPARPTSAFVLNPRDRPPPGAAAIPRGLVVATILSFDAPPEADVLDLFENAIAPAITKHGASMLASFVTEMSANTFPALPVREREHVFVWFAGFRDQAAYQEHIATLAQDEGWRAPQWEAVARRLNAAPETLRLAPTARSLLHG